jgi:hypothetical protein
MATLNLKGRYGNTERREVNAVRAALPFLLEGAYRNEPKQVVLTGDIHTVCKIPADILITKITYIVTEAYTQATSAVASIKLGATELDAALNLKVAGATASAATAPILVTAETDVTVTPTFVGAEASDAGEVLVIIEYTDYNRDTGSYIA